MNKYSFLILILVAQACVGHKNLTISGTYSGTLPCADCPGIDYQLVLNNDYTYSEKMTYQDRNVPAIRDSGTYAIKNDTILQLKNKPESTGMRQFAINKNQLNMLDMDGHSIQSGFANRYILNKVDPETVRQQAELAKEIDGRWQLQSINGEALTEGVKIPWIELKIGQDRFFGFGGCNSLNGRVDFSGDSIRFGQIISTKMACLNNNIENQFLQIFRNQSWNYEATDSTLSLLNKKNKLVFEKEK